MTEPHFFVYAIVFDRECFGIYATAQEARGALERDIREGGPAWEHCEVERWRVEGTPEGDLR